MEPIVSTNFIETPVIKMFTEGDKFYFYDTYNNRILNVNEDQFTEISELCKVGFDEYRSFNKDNKAYNDVILLMEKGYLRKSWIKEIAHPETILVPAIISRGINNLTLQVTQDCNFKCRYCLYTREHNIKRVHNKINMSWKTAKRSVDFLWDHSKDSWSTRVAFYGGEPLLNFKLIKRVIEYSKIKFESKNVEYNMTTNGSILTSEILDFFATHEVELTISLDGPEDVQNQHRKFYVNGDDTFEIVMKNVEYMRKYRPEWFERNVTFRPTLLPREKHEKVLSFFKEMNIGREKVFPAYADMEGIDYISIESMYAPAITSSNSDKDTSNINIEDPLLDFKQVFNNKRSIPQVWHHGGPCVPGKIKIFVDIDGIIYPCEKLNDSKENSVGDIYNGINIEKACSFLNIGNLTEQSCKNCFAMRFCSICMQKCYDPEELRISYRKKILYCQRIWKKTTINLKNYVREYNENIYSV